MEIELAKHNTLIDDPTIKEYVLKKKAERVATKEERIARTQGRRSGIHLKRDAAEESDDEEMDQISEEQIEEKVK